MTHRRYRRWGTARARLAGAGIGLAACALAVAPGLPFSLLVSRSSLLTSRSLLLVPRSSLLAPPAAYAQAAQPLDVRISLVEWKLTPSDVRVVAGRPVRFIATNDGAIPHALTVEGPGIRAETPAIGSGEAQRLEITFLEPGIFDLYCPVGTGLHRALGQEGTLTVVAGPVAPRMPRTGDADDLGADDPAPDDPAAVESAPPGA